MQIKMFLQTERECRPQIFLKSKYIENGVKGGGGLSQVSVLLFILHCIVDSFYRAVSRDLDDVRSMLK